MTDMDGSSQNPTITYKNGSIMIEAFRARIDFSRAIQFQRNKTIKYKDSTQSTVSPYFKKSSQESWIPVTHALKSVDK